MRVTRLHRWCMRLHCIALVNSFDLAKDIFECVSCCLLCFELSLYRFMRRCSCLILKWMHCCLLWYYDAVASFWDKVDKSWLQARKLRWHVALGPTTLHPLTNAYLLILRRCRSFLPASPTPKLAMARWCRRWMILRRCDTVRRSREDWTSKWTMGMRTLSRCMTLEVYLVCGDAEIAVW